MEILLQVTIQEDNQGDVYYNTHLKSYMLFRALVDLQCMLAHSMVEQAVPDDIGTKLILSI